MTEYSEDVEDELFKCFICFGSLSETVIFPCCSKYSCLLCIAVIDIFNITELVHGAKSSNLSALPDSINFEEINRRPIY